MPTPTKKVGILTTFYKIDPGYSLCAVVLDQLQALVKHGYAPVLYTLPQFKDDALVPKGVEVRNIVPQVILEPYKELGFPDHWKEDAKKVEEMFKKNMEDIDVLIAHDIFFIDTYLPYNIGLREALTALPKMKILAWTHSAPSSRPKIDNNPHANRFNLPERTKLVYLNHDKVVDLAEMYAAWPKDVRVVRNARDPRTFWGLDPFVISLIERYNLFEADIISVYPLSTPRMISGKGLDKVIKIHSKLKQLGYKTRLIVPNAHANGPRDQKLISDTMVFASERGIDHTELIFTSQEDRPDYEHGVPPKIVSDLFRISNIFVFPTVSENSSLVLLEAMLSGNLLVLNRNVGTLKEHAGEKALYFDFNYREDEKVNENYFLDLAKIIASEFEQDKALQVKRRALQNHNYDRIFQKEIEPLLHEYES